MTQFEFRLSPFIVTHRCGWCLDWIMTGRNERKPENCPYCGSDLSTKSPKYDKMMSRLMNDRKLRLLDDFLERLRTFQYQKKINVLPPKIQQWSPLGMGKGGHVIAGVASPLEKLEHVLEYLRTNPGAPDIEEKKRLVYRIGVQAYHARPGHGFDSMTDSFNSAINMLADKYAADLERYRRLWNGICDEWKY